MLVGAAKPALDKRSQYSIGLLSPVLCCHRYARLGTFAVMTSTVVQSTVPTRARPARAEAKFTIIRVEACNSGYQNTTNFIRDFDTFSVLFTKNYISEKSSKLHILYTKF